MNNHAIQLHHYHLWANNRVLEGLKALPEEILHAPITGVFRSLAEALVHIAVVDTLWLGVMREDPFDAIVASCNRVRNDLQGTSLDGLEAKYAEIAGWYREFFEGVEDWDRAMTIHHPEHGLMETKLRELVQHVVNHATYHRGHISALLHQAGHAGVSTDYIYYLYEIGNTLS